MTTENDTSLAATAEAPVKGVGCGDLLGEIDRMRSDYRAAVGPHLDREDLVKAAECERIVRICTDAIDALSFRRFEHVLLKHGLIDHAAIEDPEGFDNYRTHGAIHAAHRDLLSSPNH